MAADAAGARRPVPGGLPPRRIVEALFPDSRVAYVSDYEAIADLYDTFGDQRPSTCGAYAARYLLAPLGHGGGDAASATREDYLAWLAGTVLEAHEVAPAAETEAEARALGLTDVEAAARFPDTYYGWPLRASADPAVAGTSPTGVARAVSVGSGGALVTLPVAARAADGTVLLTPERMEPLLALLMRQFPAWQVHPIANYESDQLLDPEVVAYAPEGLTAPDPAAVIPRDHWGVGHFTGIGALWRSRDERGWALLLDTYKARGWSGYEPQPAELLRRGMVRSDGRDGGMLLVLPREHADAARIALEDIGLAIRMWGNGSLEPEDWAWEAGR